MGLIRKGVFSVSSKVYQGKVWFQFFQNLDKSIDKYTMIEWNTYKKG